MTVSPVARKRGLSLQTRLSALIVLMVAPLIGVLAFNSASRQVHLQMGGLSAKALSFGRILAHGAAPAIAFKDRQTARELFESVALDSDFAAAALFTDRGQLLEGRGSLSSATIAARDSVIQEGRVDIAGDRLRATIPVVSIEGPRGMLLVELSLARVAHERAGIIVRSVGLGGLALVLGALAAFAIGLSLGRRIRAVERVASAVASGDLNQADVVVRGNDEIGTMGLAFNAMMHTIRDLVSTIRETARGEAQRLEGMVQVRTAELNERNLAMRTLLDNVDQGFLTIRRSGAVAPERSAVVERWFPHLAEDVLLWQAIGRLDPRVGAWIEMGWSMLLEDVFPIEVSLDQLPKQLALGDCELELAFRPLGDDIMCVITDVTAINARERLERSERQRLALFRHILKQRASLVAFLAEANGMFKELQARMQSVGPRVLHLLHTLKGNCASLGLVGLADGCHEMESALDQGQELTADRWEPLLRQWRELHDWISPLLGEGERKVELSETEHAAFLQALQRGTPSGVLLAWAATWALEPTKQRLATLADGAMAVAKRLNRSRVLVECHDDGVRTSPGRLDALWSALVHPIRNSLDHGYESDDLRLAHGKALEMSLRFATTLIEGDLCIELFDDGAGVDWARLAAKARAHGLPAGSQAELVAAMLADSISTRDEITEISGRGVGMGALREAVAHLGGRIQIDSRPGRGTTVRCLVPAGAVGAVRSSAILLHQQKTPAIAVGAA